MIPRLDVEDLEKRKRIVANSHDGNHFGVHRTNDVVSSKYYWLGLFTDVRQYASFKIMSTYKCRTPCYLKYRHLSSETCEAVSALRTKCIFNSL